MSDPFELVGVAVVSAKGARRLREGHPWIYQSDVERVPGEAPGLARVTGRDGKTHGVALFSPRSKISLRLLTTGDAPPDARLLARRVLDACARRERSMRGADAYRVVHGEADFLPGLFVDRYADAFVLQSTTAAAELFEPLVIETLVRAHSPSAVVVKDDSSVRAREGLRQHVTLVHGTAPVVRRYHEGNIELEVDLLADQKTGSFLDQAQNHVVAGRYARGEGLDCFSYHGGFALQLATGGCSRVLACDISAGAVERCRANALRAGVSNVEAVERDVFDLLPELLASGRRFDTIVVDPPAFASSRHTVDKALRAYKEVNLRAMKLLRPNGVLVTCSCSGRVTANDFDQALDSAARDARRAVQILERRGAGPDHPVLAAVPETEYLKCRVLAVT